MAEPLTAWPVEFLFRLEAETGSPPPVSVPGGPHGDRLIVTATSGTFVGPRLRGRIVPGPGSEWATAMPGGVVRADVRLVLETDDGAAILMTYRGVGRPEEGTLRVRTAPLFETGDERYRWLNEVQAVGRGEPIANGIGYDVYRLR